MPRITALVGAALLALPVAACGTDTAPIPRPTPTASASAISPGAALGKTAADAAKKLPIKPPKRPTAAPGTTERGTPGAFCSASRVGDSFAKKGVTYTCKGPKPYRWRRS